MHARPDVHAVYGVGGTLTLCTLSYVPGVVPLVQEGALISGYILVHIGRHLYACSTVRESRPEALLGLVSEYGVLVYMSARVAWLIINGL